MAQEVSGQKISKQFHINNLYYLLKHHNKKGKDSTKIQGHVNAARGEKKRNYRYIQANNNNISQSEPEGESLKFINGL